MSGPWCQNNLSITVSSDPPIGLELKMITNEGRVLLIGILTLPDGARYMFNAESPERPKQEQAE